MSAAFASTSPPHPAAMLSIPLSSPPDPLAACDPLTLLDDPFPPLTRTNTAALPRLSPPHFVSAPRPSRPPLPSPLTATNQPTALSPRLYATSPRLPSALPPSASPRVVEPVTPDRQPLPFSAEDAAVLCERAPLGTVDERAAAYMFDSVPRRLFPRPVSTTAPATDAPSQHGDNAMRLQLPLDPSVTAPPPPIPPIPSSSLMLDTSSTAVPGTTTAAAAAAAAAAAVASASNPASSSQNVLSPFGLSARPSAAALAAAVEGSALLPWGKEGNDHTQTIVSSSASKGASNEPVVSSAFTAAAVAAAVAEAQIACSMGTTHRPAPTSIAASASLSLPDISLFSSSTYARSICPLTQVPDLVHAPPATSSISDMDMQVTRPSTGPPSNQHTMSDDSPLRRPANISKRSMPSLGVSTTASAPDPASDRLRCHMCGQRFARRSNLFKHLRSVHDDRRRFACRSCPYKFKRQDHLLKHMRSVHDRRRNFVCDICGFGFAEKFNRDKHRRSIHMTKRAFQCPCGAYFQDREKMLKCLRCRQPSNASTAQTACISAVGTATL